jgi:uncharacterized protein GlcG (DUF336 family)
MRRTLPVLSAFLLLSAGIQSAPASELPSRPYLSLRIANEAVMKAVAVCEQNGYGVTATIIDPSGLTKSVAKADLAGPHTTDSSRLKAYTALSLGPTFHVLTTGEVAAKAFSTPTGASLANVPGFLLFAGGILIQHSGQPIGAIGVGGAGNGEKDQVCAQAAVDLIAERLH